MSRPRIHLIRLVLATAALATALTVAPAAAQAAGELGLTPAQLDFPATTVEYPGGQQQVEVKNTGDESVWIGNVWIDGSEAGDFNQNNDCGGELKPDTACSVNVNFWPHGEGTRNATLHVSSDAPNPDVTAPLVGTGVPPELSFEPDSYDFGLQQINNGGVQANLVLRNSGDASVQVNSLDIVTSGQNPFWIGNSDCWGRTLAPQDTCNVQVNFGPNQTIAYSAQARAMVNGVSFTADLSGEGGNSVFGASPDPADFGSAGVGGSGVTRTITLTNNGNLPGGFFVAIVSGGDIDSFKVLHEDCNGTPIDPSESCTAEVRFRPDSSGPKAATLTFVGGQDDPFQMRLTGEGVDPRTSLTPDGHDFGRLPVGATSRAQDFELKNDGDTPLRMSGASIVGGDADQFRLAGDECTDVTLDPGASCSVQVRFAPDARGSRTARLRLLGDGGPLTASLTGVGGPKAKGLVSFHWSDALSTHRRGLAVGDASCHSDSRCRLRARAVIRGRHTSVKLPAVHLALGAGKSRSLRFRLPGAARVVAHRGGHLKLVLDWSADGYSGHIRAARRVG